ncbi:MAG: class I SAM-dependent methyltransferase [Xanthomonadaceae bacterium]|nr:methyltransferase domain-containing protein [Xanthomonadaceae bacterium]MDE2225382.1 class I SAM-dependent methyltransferase [Xanthomonadaceae bacterium]MDE2496960.1 class I SAM-dependent methyltransferase [Xanthomonadaceae bacterium]
MTCKLCGGATEPFGELAVLGRHRAHYQRCRACGYVAVENPHWLDEAYADHAIAALDTGIAMRNLWLADAVDALLRWRFRGVRTALDYGGGTGLFVRLMRDRGHDFHWSDPHCENLFALGFEAGDNTACDLVTCFEVAEHMVDPLPAFRQLGERAPVLIFSTELLPERNNRPGEWHYYAPETGQHVGFFTAASLRGVANQLGRHFASDGRMLHAFTTEPLDPRWLRVVAKQRRARRLLRLAGKRTPLTWRDAETLTQALRTQQSANAPPA